MLVSLSDRGPDSAGIAIYGSGDRKHSKVTIQSANPERDFANLGNELGETFGAKVGDREIDPCGDRSADRQAREARLAPSVASGPMCASWAPATSSRSTRRSACPHDVVDRFDLTKMSGTHGIGHTRMATESAVTTLGAHPFSTGPDQCLVHNGSLSNHNNVRRELKREGMTFETENDTEVAAAYISNEMAQGQQSRSGAGRRRFPTSTASSPSSSAPRTASAWCAIRSPASPRSWPRPTTMSPSAPSTAPLPTCPASTMPRCGSPSRPTSFLGALMLHVVDPRQIPLRDLESSRFTTSGRARTRPPGR